MNRKSALLFSVLALIALLSFPVLAQDEQGIPFKATVSGTVTAPVPINSTTIFAVGTGGGKGTVLGKFTYVIPHYVNLANGTLTGVIAMTAANGDVLLGTVVGQVTPTATPGVITLYEEITITGGTGRFEDAAGSIVVNGPANPGAGEVGPLDMEGTISF
jgi:hypothetical protein